jgi:hypothetical protein
MRIQGVKLMTMLAGMVYNLHLLGQVLPAIRDLGQREWIWHQARRHDDYDAVEYALLWP